MCYNSSMKVKVFAKINLTLNVYPRRGEFHPIDSVVTSVDVFDVVQVQPRNDGVVTVSGCDVPLCANSAYRAAVMFAERFATGGADIVICKGIPIGGGMGGSSADAAAVLHCMGRLYGVDEAQVVQLCPLLGSDVTFMLHGGLGRMTGKGDDVQFCPYVPMYFVLTQFDFSVSSRDAYAAFDVGGFAAEPHRDNDLLLKLLARGDCDGALALCGNGLQLAVRGITNYADRYFAAVEQLGGCAHISGSGSSCYVPFADKRRALHFAANLRALGFDAQVCASVPRGIVPA